MNFCVTAFPYLVPSTGITSPESVLGYFYSCSLTRLQLLSQKYFILNYSFIYILFDLRLHFFHILFYFYRKSNRTELAIKMLERCINLEPRFVPAYLELVKFYRGPKAGKILEQAVAVSPKTVDLRIQYGDWLYENSK